MSTMLLAALLLQTDVAVERYEIVMVSQATCAPCQQWKQSDHPSTLKNAGWTLTIEEWSRLAHPTVNRLPTFIVKVPGKPDKRYTGYTTAATLMGTVVPPQEPAKVLVEYQGESYDANSYVPCGDPRCTMCPYILSFKNTGNPMAATPDEVITKMLGLMNLNNTSILGELGCGDARILIEAVKKYDCSAVGVEIDEEKYAEAVQAVKDAGLEDKILILNEDARKFVPALYGVTHLTAFLYDDLLKELRPVFDQVPTVATPFHKVPGLPMTKFDAVWIHRG
jgi:hypothetical protein